MKGGFRSLVHPATAARAIDIDGTRAAREAMREQLSNEAAHLRPVTSPRTVPGTTLPPAAAVRLLAIAVGGLRRWWA